MADIRGLPATAFLEMGRLVLATPTAGLTVGSRYWPLSLGVDCQPAPPVIYVLVSNDAGLLVAVPAASFRFGIDNLQP